jgi:pimeloyl-ACP methyl ester carboxylesterase
LPPSKSTVTSADGTRLAVYTYEGEGPVLLCVHGYPDNAAMWGPVAELLRDDFQVVAYDVRGAGESDHPTDTSRYTLDRLEEDFLAVIDQVSPGRAVHVLAHDWGSIQAWHPVTNPALRHRIASFTSISGPSLDHAGYFLRRPGKNKIRQAIHSWYIYYFHIPRLPEWVWRHAWARKRLDAGYDRSVADYTNGLELYRANIRKHLLTPEERYTDVPVLVISPEADAFVTTALQTGIERWVPNLHVEVVRGGHWMPREQPGEVARLVREHTRRVAP